jgi:hypothetical protein
MDSELSKILECVNKKISLTREKDGPFFNALKNDISVRVCPISITIAKHQNQNFIMCVINDKSLVVIQGVKNITRNIVEKKIKNPIAEFEKIYDLIDSNNLITPLML